MRRRYKAPTEPYAARLLPRRAAKCAPLPTCVDHRAGGHRSTHHHLSRIELPSLPSAECCGDRPTRLLPGHIDLSGPALRAPSIAHRRDRGLLIGEDDSWEHRRNRRDQVTTKATSPSDRQRYCRTRRRDVEHVAWGTSLWPPTRAVHDGWLHVHKKRRRPASSECHDRGWIELPIPRVVGRSGGAHR